MAVRGVGAVHVADLRHSGERRIEATSEMDCFTFSASDGEIVDISVVGQADGGSFVPAWRLLDRDGNDVDG